MSECEKCKDAFIFHRDYKRGDNKKVFSHSDITKGIERYEKKIQDLEAKLAEAVELIDCTSDRWGKCKCRSCKFLESLEEKEAEGEYDTVR